ncbi:MAG: hypothetical protein HYR97_08810 [Candidatus Melainabacteria bacterium]|nr:hypothetical protein [Candidatus Melainabacteria bacterium]MBI3309495.1 hypothetical protein [Candidatus Melainabacteria bacterium]
MQVIYKTIILLAIFTFCAGQVFASAERYDKILEALENETPLQEEIITDNNHLPPSVGEDLPTLNGIWIFKKTTERRIQPALIIPVHNTFCNATLPIDKWDFERKVVINEQHPGHFTIRNLYPANYDIYAFPREKDIVYSSHIYKSDKGNVYSDDNSEDIVYQNYGFKGVIDPENLTYSYSLRLANHSENQNLARDISFSARVNYDMLSARHIVAKGYETYYTPICHGFVRDDITLEFKKIKSFKNREDTIEANGPITIEDDIMVDIPEVKNTFPKSFYTLKDFDTAKDKSGFTPSPQYGPIDNTTSQPIAAGSKESPAPKVKVPGMW